MAHDPATVDAFLDRIIGPAVAKAKEEVADMQVIMDEDIQAGKVAAGSRIEPWDWFYYAEKVRQRKYSLDENLTKPYFRMENVRNGIFFAANKLYGISVEPLKDVPLYNPCRRGASRSLTRTEVFLDYSRPTISLALRREAARG